MSSKNSNIPNKNNTILNNCTSPEVGTNAELDAELEVFPRPWKAQDVRISNRWIRDVTHQERQGLLDGLAAFEGQALPFWQSTGENFPFHSIASLIGDTRAELKRGFGFIVLRGFPIDELTTEQIGALYWGFCNHLGVLRPQGRNSGLLESVRDAGGQYRSQSGRGYNTNARLDYHTDFADLVGLLCINAARSGGESLVTSSLALRDEIGRHASHLVEALYEPVDYSRQDEHAEEQKPFYTAPIFSEADGQFSCRYTRNHIRYAHRHEGAQAPTDNQQQAMDFLDKLAADDAFSYEMALQPGDLQILNNHIVLHSRREFVDYEESEYKRHLMRAWIATPDSQPLDRALNEAYFDHESGTVRGGILGQHFDNVKQDYTQRAAAFHNMPWKHA